MFKMVAKYHYLTLSECILRRHFRQKIEIDNPRGRLQAELPRGISILIKNSS
jgi:hypothetical protein